ncbi:MAG: hypothetical protein D6681_08425, partial [Calditrichaeota bacterium]
WEKLNRDFKKPYFSVGILLQTVGDFQIERNIPGTTNGFTISNLRLNVGGELDHHFGYFIQANFINQPAILDARMYYRIAPGLVVEAGQFKAPFSREFLTGAASIDFVNRAEAVTALSPGRQIGAQIRGALGNEVFHYAVGVFNGNGIGANGNENNHLMVVGRGELRLRPNVGKDHAQLSLGASAATSTDRDVRLPGYLFFSYFTGDRTVWEVDARLEWASLLLAGEYLSGHLDGRFESQIHPQIIGQVRIRNTHPFGYYLTAGYKIIPPVQALLRYEYFDSDLYTPLTRRFIAGINIWPTQATEIQINYLINRDDSEFKHHQLLINAQIGF